MADILRMPSLSPTMETGILQKWMLPLNTLVNSGDILALIETDKAIVEYESLNEGYLRHCFVNEGSTVNVGQPIAVFTEEPEEDIQSIIEKRINESIPHPPSQEKTPTPKHNSSPPILSPINTDYDVAVIGAGPGGYVAAIRAAQLGLKTVLIDKEWLGGVCLNVGCIPSKALLKGAELIYQLKEHGPSMGIHYENLHTNYADAVKRSRLIAAKLTQGIGYLVKKNKIDVRTATATFKDPFTLILENTEGTSIITSKYTIIATGASPRSIPGVTIDGQQVLTYREAILQEILPKSVVIIGSGAIGVEFATIWNAYGAAVTLIEMQPRLVPLEDEDVSIELKRAFEKKGIQSSVSTKLEGIECQPHGVKVTVSSPNGTQTLLTDQVLVAIGFTPNLTQLGLDALNIQQNRGTIEIDAKMRTNLPNIYAIGDVTGRFMLAHVASAMGIIAAETIAEHPTQPINYSMIPRATYCHPQIASFGLTEPQASNQGYSTRVSKFPFSANGKALGLGEDSGFVKLIVDSQSGEILGAHLIGPDVTELLPELTLAQSQELTIEEIARNIHAHPTLSETIMEAAHGLTGGYIHL